MKRPRRIEDDPALVVSIWQRTKDLSDEELDKAVQSLNNEGQRYAGYASMFLLILFGFVRLLVSEPVANVPLSSSITLGIGCVIAGFFAAVFVVISFGKFRDKTEFLWAKVRREIVAKSKEK